MPGIRDLVQAKQVLIKVERFGAKKSEWEIN
jgi:hypothetical protein